MNSIVALPIAAAVPVASPSMAAARDPKAEVARLEQAVELLRTRHVCEGWKMDEAGAGRALRYFRAGCPDDDEEWGATIAFISSHGLSFDWICGGDVSSMVCMLASSSQRAKRDAADPIFKAIADHHASGCALSAGLNVMYALEAELPKELRKSNINVWEEVIVETDDPRWIESERNVRALFDADENAAMGLINIEPTTLAGLLALMRHVTAYEARGDGWPSGLQEDDAKPTAIGKDWEVYLHRNIAALLEDYAAPLVA